MVFLVTSAPDDIAVVDGSLVNQSDPNFVFAAATDIYRVDALGAAYVDVDFDGNRINLPIGTTVPVTPLTQYTALASGEADALLLSFSNLENFLSLQETDPDTFAGYSVIEVTSDGTLPLDLNPDQLAIQGYWPDPLTGLEDLRDLKVAVFGDSRLEQLVEDAGGVPVSLPVAELAAALMAGVVDGAISNTPGFLETFQLSGYSLFSADLGAFGLSNISSSTPGSEPVDDAPPVENDVTPALVYDLGGKFDLGLNQNAFEGAERWAAETGGVYADQELFSEAQRESVLQRFAEDGNSPVVTVGFAFNTAVDTVATAFPDTQFAIIDSEVDQPNVGSYTFDVSEGAYVMGVIAAAATTTGTVGFVGGMDTPFSRSYSDAFAAGVEATRPGTEVLVYMTGTTPAAWNDPVKGAELALVQMQAGADVIFTPAGGTSVGVLQAVADYDEGQVYSIANDVNSNATHPGSVLTSLVKEVGVVVEDVFQNGITPGTTELGFAEGGWSYAFDDNNASILTADIRAAADAAIASFGGTTPGDLSPSTPIEGSAESESLSGSDADDTLVGFGGDDMLDGGAGVDTAVYSGPQTSYTLTLTPANVTLEDRRAGENGTDTLTAIEFLDFDTDLFGAPFDLGTFGGAANLSQEAFESFIELYIAYFNRAPDAVGLNFWGTAFANGTTLEEIATLFIDQTETRALYPDTLSNDDFIAAVYDNVLGRLGDADGVSFWRGVLDDTASGVGRDQFILEVLRGARSDPDPTLGQAFVDQQLADRQYLENKTDIGAYYAVVQGLSDVANAQAAMALFDGSDDSITAAVSAIDGFQQAALDPNTGEFLMPLVGVLENPFSL